MITKELRAFGFSELQKLRKEIFFEVPLGQHNFLPPDAFLSDDTIKLIIDKLYLIKDEPDIAALVGGNPLLDNHHQKLLQQCHTLREEFKAQCAEKAAKRKAQRQAASMAVPASDAKEQASEDNGGEEAMPLVSESQSDSKELQVQQLTSNLKWKINFRYERYYSRWKYPLTLLLYRSGTIVSVLDNTSEI
jgi:hypothetical protein